MSKRLMTWSLFAVAAFTVPVIFFLFQVAVLLPLAALPICAFQVGLSPVGGIILLVIHLVILVPLLWGAAWLVATLIGRIPAAIGQRVALAACVGALIGWAAVGPYEAGGHGTPVHASWLGAFTKLCRG
jgi:hypothetical protein